MNVTSAEGHPRSSTMKVAICITLALLVVIGAAGAAAWTLFGGHSRSAHAAGILSQATAGQPWGMTLDGNGNLWVAEPNCDGNPVCGAPPQGEIGEYNAAAFTKIADYIPPAGTIYTPMFVAVNGSRVWFTDPTHNAIGNVAVTGTGTGIWSEISIAATYPGAVPVDLAFDSAGNLWYTDFGTGSIGKIAAGSSTPVETKTPTAGTAPYGITIAGNKVWFTENSLSSVGSFTLPAGTLTTAAITEHTFSGAPHATPHLITTDAAGNAWFSTGFGGQIGEVTANALNLFCVSNTVSNPHISGIGVDPSGKVWFDDSQNGRVGYLTPSAYVNDCSTGSSAGVTYGFFNGAHTHDGLLVDGHGNVFVGEQFNNQIAEIPAGAALPAPPVMYPPGPVAKTWYFAEGRVGGGFREFITIDNPSPSNPCIVDFTYLRENGTPAAAKLTVAPASRATESVNNDLGNISATSATGVSVAAIVSNDPISPCVGFAAERPMYFNYHGNQSNTDVFGATHLNTNFYFADVPSGGGYSSYLTILNPPGGKTATVTATYYANGAQAGTQTITVASGQRGTIAPAAIGLPQHSAAYVTSSQPVVIERPTYYMNVDGGIAGSVSGAASVVGSQVLQNEFFFAEGFAGTTSSGGATEEKLVIANLDTVAKATANVTINLEYVNGTKNSFKVTVAPNSQLIWDVNTNGLNPGSKEVSADIVSAGAAIVASRQMFFNYAHTLPRGVLQAKGVTEVTGLAGPAGTAASYSFAEGYSNYGFNEWLTLQNPTANAETIYITIVNGYGRIYTMTQPLGANTRATIDVTNLVLTHLAHSGDDHRGYEVAMTVQTLNNGGFFVAERPEYQNTFGITGFPTQGGNDAFGYSGQ